MLRTPAEFSRLVVYLAITVDCYENILNALNYTHCEQPWFYRICLDCSSIPAGLLGAVGFAAEGTAGAFAVAAAGAGLSLMLAMPAALAAAAAAAAC